MELQWFRLYSEAVDDEKLRLLAFEDRWHFIALLCCKSKGILDNDSGLIHRKVAVKLGIDVKTLEDVSRRLAEVGLIEEKTLQPLAWANRQFISDRSAERVRAYRERKRKQSNVTCNGYSNVTVTAQDTDTEQIQNRSTPLAQSDKNVTPAEDGLCALADPFGSPRAAASPCDPVSVDDKPVAFIPMVGGNGDFKVSASFAAELENCFPAVDCLQTLAEIRAWNLANPTRRKTARGIKRHITQWFQRVQDS
jgi:hypothetical protein